jgi:alcohol dehydrogenase, propanol-preferring
MKSFQVADFNAPLKEVDQPTPQPSGTQVLIKVKAAGVCHSDLHIWEGGYDLGHGRKPLSLKDRGVSLPLTMGHETVGEVLAFGPDAKADTGGLKVGDIVLAYPWLGCGKCETCRAGDENMCVVKPSSLGVYCDGGYADHMIVPNPKYLLSLKGRHRGALRLLRCHHLQRAEESRIRLPHADRHFRCRRAWPDGAVAAQGDGRQGRHRR